MDRKQERVRMINIIGRPIGFITRDYWPTQYETLHWVRLENGILLKDVTDSELKFVGEKIKTI